MSEIPEDIREKAERLVYEARMECNWASLHNAVVRLLLAERLSATERAAKMRVKPLEWEEARVSDRWARFTASTILGNYEALEWSDGTFGGSVPAEDRDDVNIEFTAASIDEAKAVAQDHFATRIAAAIRSQP